MRSCCASLRPKKAKRRLDDFEELQHHRRDAAKMAGTRAAFETVAQSFDIHRRAKTGGIDFLGRRREEIVDAEIFERGAVRLHRRADISGNPPTGRTAWDSQKSRRPRERTACVLRARAKRWPSCSAPMVGTRPRMRPWRARVVRDLLHPIDGVECFHGECAERGRCANVRLTLRHARRALAIENDQIGRDGLRAQLPQQRGDLAAMIGAVIREVLQHLPARLRLRYPAVVL